MKYSIYLSLNVVLISILIAGGCSDINSGDNEPEIRIEQLEDESEHYFDVEALQKSIEDLKKYPEIIKQLNKNRDHPLTVEEQIKEYQAEIEEMKSPEYQKETEKLKKMMKNKESIDSTDINYNSYFYSNYCQGISRIHATPTGRYSKKVAFVVTTSCRSRVSRILHILNYQIRKDGRSLSRGTIRKANTFFYPRNFTSTNFIHIYYPVTVFINLRSTHDFNMLRSNNVRSFAGAFI